MVTWISQYTIENGVETEIRATIDDRSIAWLRFEHMQFYEGEHWTEEQSFADYLAHGPPELAAGLTDAKRVEIDAAVRQHGARGASTP